MFPDDHEGGKSVQELFVVDVLMIELPIKAFLLLKNNL